MTHRSICFTIFDEEWKHEVLKHENIKCACVQKECCPDTGRNHYQGYCQFNNPCRFGKIKEILKCESAHLEKTKGTPQQAWDYCCKEESRIDGPWTYGDRPKGAGAR